MAYRRRRSSFLKRLGGKPRRGSKYFDIQEKMGGFGLDWSLSNETKKGIIIIFLFVLAALSLLGLFDLSGTFGQLIVKLLSWLLGSLKWLFPVIFFLFGYFMLRADSYQIKMVNYLGVFFLVLGLTALWHLQFAATEAVSVASAGWGGGYIGLILSWPLLKFMGFWSALVMALAVFLIGLLLTFETSLYGLMWPVKLIRFLYNRFSALTRSRIIKPSTDDYEEEDEAIADEETDEEIEAGDEPQFAKKTIATTATDKTENASPAKIKKFGKKIELPLELLVAKSGKPTSGDIKNNQFIIKKTLSNFGIEVEMGDVNIGPTVTQYTLRPADGVKLSRLINLNSDLALALAAHPIRIEAPIPGKSLVGIEIPNQLAAKVTMNEILSSPIFKTRDSNLMLVLGRDVSGAPYLVQLDKMPHLLIAGATGSGKSVCINSLITSLLYQNSPDELKFILVDPKRVELPVYNGIPYLLTPVITDVKKTINALKWTTVEMDRRFEVLARAGKRNIAAYNKNTTDKLPYIVFIIDELADLMSIAANDVEAGIVRLAQMARAVGIYLILATQRPSVEVITGLIKANIPARIAFSVASLIDSRTILDASGAEKLVGRGDMLYIGPETVKPKRIQGVYISDRETSNIINYIKQQGTADYNEEVVEKQSFYSSQNNSSFYDDGGDNLLSEAKEVIRESGKASASLLQRRLKIGYARAARILDLLEEQGLIGPVDGAKPREVFLDRLGGVDALTFAAKEHDLEGELKPFGYREEEETADDYSDDFEEVEESDNLEDEINDRPALPAQAERAGEEVNKDEEENDKPGAVEEAEVEGEEPIEEEMEDEPKAGPEEADSKTEKINSQPRPPIGGGGKKFFSDDEWT